MRDENNVTAMKELLELLFDNKTHQQVADLLATLEYCDFRQNHKGEVQSVGSRV